MLKTPFYEKSLEYKPKIVDFYGWALPLDYGSVLREAKLTREACALFDVSHMGRLIIKGKKREEFLQELSSNDISKLKEGKLQYNLFITPEGTILDDFMVYNLGDMFLCVVNASNRDKDLTWLQKHNRQGVDIIDETEQSSLLSLQGPKAVKLMETILEESLEDLKYMTFIRRTIKNIFCVISRSGYTGEDGFEIYFAKENGPVLWDMILEKGKPFNLTLVGLGARDVLRIEAAYPLYGNEINETTNPLEASLGWVVKMKEKDFIGKESISRVLKEGISRKRVGFIMEERSFSRKGYLIYARGQENDIIGEVTSGTYSPALDKFIGMAYVNMDFAKPGTSINIKIRNKLYLARVKSFPFIKTEVKK